MRTSQNEHSPKIVHFAECAFLKTIISQNGHFAKRALLYDLSKSAVKQGLASKKDTVRYGYFVFKIKY
jgi:hypothetical protein